MVKSLEFNAWLDEWSQQLKEWESKTGQTLLKGGRLIVSPPRGRIEIWLDKHNHKMELLRTMASVTAALASIVIFMKVFGVL